MFGGAGSTYIAFDGRVEGVDPTRMLIVMMIMDLSIRYSIYGIYRCSLGPHKTRIGIE